MSVSVKEMKDYINIYIWYLYYKAKLWFDKINEKFKVFTENTKNIKLCPNIQNCEFEFFSVKNIFENL